MSSSTPITESWLLAAESLFAQAAGNTVSDHDLAAIAAAGLSRAECVVIARRISEALDAGTLTERERSTAYFALSKRYDPGLIPKFRVWLAHEVRQGGAIYQLMIALDTLGEPVFGSDRDGYAASDTERNLQDARAYLADLGAPGPTTMDILERTANTLILTTPGRMSMPAAAAILRWLEGHDDCAIPDQGWKSSGYGDLVEQGVRVQLDTVVFRVMCSFENVFVERISGSKAKFGALCEDLLRVEFEPR